MIDTKVYDFIEKEGHKDASLAVHRFQLFYETIPGACVIQDEGKYYIVKEKYEKIEKFGYDTEEEAKMEITEGYIGIPGLSAQKDKYDGLWYIVQKRA